MTKLMKVWINGKSGESEDHSYETQLEYNPGAKLFFIRVPEDQLEFKPEIQEEVDLVRHIKIRGAARYDTPVFVGEIEKEVTEKAAKYYSLFLKADRSEKKIIAYHLAYYSKSRSLKHDVGLYSQDDYTERLQVGYHVLFEVRVGGAVTYQERSTFLLSGGKKHERIDDVTYKVGGNFSHKYSFMDHTPEREEFFKRLVAGMGDLVEMIHKATEDTEVLVAAIDRGEVPLLLGPKDDTSSGES